MTSSNTTGANGLSWRGNFHGHFVAIILIFSLVVAGIVGLFTSHGQIFFVGVRIFFVLAALLMLSNFSHCWIQKLTVTDTAILNPKGNFRRQSISIDDISGIGLMNSFQAFDRSSAYGKGWAPTIWLHGVDQPIRLSQFIDKTKIIGYQGQKGSRPVTLSSNLPSEAEQWQHIAQTSSAKIVLALYNFVKGKQGPSGYLSLESQQLRQPMEHIGIDPTFMRAIWCPDGRLRRRDVESVHSV